MIIQENISENIIKWYSNLPGYELYELGTNNRYSEAYTSVDYQGQGFEEVPVVGEVMNSDIYGDAYFGPQVEYVERCGWGATVMELPSAKYIGYQAFMGANGVMDINIPEAKTIGNEAFYSCEQLTTISAPNVETIGGASFVGCTNMMTAELTSVKKIGNNAFASCGSLQSLTLPNVEFIGQGAFMDTPNLTELNIPHGVDVAPGAFDGSNFTPEDFDANVVYEIAWVDDSIITLYSNDYGEAIQQVKLINCTGTAGEYIFQNCYDLVDAQLPAMTYAKKGLFSDSGIQSAKLTSLVESERDLFNGCRQLQKLEMPNIERLGDSCFQSAGLAVMSFPKLELASAWMARWAQVQVVDLPAATELRGYAFGNCEMLTDVNIPAVTWIDESVFDGCYSLVKIDLPSVERIDNWAFANCSSLQAVKLHYTGGVVQVGSAVFDNCYPTVYVPDEFYESYISDENWSNQNCTIDMLSNYVEPVEQFDLEDFSITSVADNEYATEPYISSLHNIYLPHCASIGNRAFAECQSLGSVNLGALTSIGDQVFDGTGRQTQDTYIVSMNNLVEMNGRQVFRNSGINQFYANNLQVIGDFAFNRCDWLSTVSVPCCRIIGTGAFAGCTLCNFENAFTPEVIEEIRDYAFQGCTNISRNVLNSLLMYTGSVGYQAFKGCNVGSQIVLYSATFVDGTSFDSDANTMLALLAPTVVTMTRKEEFAGTVVVPDEWYEDYKRDPEWAGFERIIKSSET